MKNAQVAFVHIPRTAGSTLGAILNQNFSSDTIQDFYVDDNEKLATQRINEFVAMTTEQKCSYGVVKGHFSYGFDTALDNADYLTFLREPINRLTSYYFYALANDSHYLKQWIVKDRVGIEDFLTSNVSTELDNFQVRMISGFDFNNSSKKVDQQHLDIAKHNLEHKFKAFGITEEFDLSVFYLSKVMGWKLPYYKKINVARNKFGFKGLNEKTLAEVSELNRFDIELYQFGLKLYQQRLEALGQTFERQFSHFKHRNQYFLSEKPGIKSRLLQFAYRRMELPQD